MSVHIDELHTDVVGPGSGPGYEDPASAARREEERERARRERLREAWLAARVAAEGFDD